MKKRIYIAPYTNTICFEVCANYLANTSNEEYGHGSDSDSKENTGLWDDVDDEEPWSSVTESSNDLWGSDENEEE